MTPGTSVSAHVLNMKGLIDLLDKLGASISPELATDMILGSLPESYDQFVMNYNMHHMEKSSAYGSKRGRHEKKRKCQRQ